MSMALDKNYIDTTTFDVLQPAIDYYLTRGTADEKLRTLYYQGRIYQNNGELDNALNSFFKGMDISCDCRDSLTIARMLVAQGGLYDELYDFESYTNCHLKAAKIYKQLFYSWNEFDCLLNALNGTISLGDKVRADSLLLLLLLCDEFKNLDSTEILSLAKHKISYAIKFGDTQKAQYLIEHQNNSPIKDANLLLNLALAHNKMGNNVEAKRLLDNLEDGQIYDTLKYMSISVPILESMGNYKEALAIYKNFSRSIDSINTFKFEQKSKYIEEKHHLEIKVQQESSKNAAIIWSCVGGIIFLIMVVLILLLRYRNNKTQKNLALERAKISELENMQVKAEKAMAVQKAKIIELENERLKSEKELAQQKTKATQLENEKLKVESEKLSIENKNLILERNKKAIEAENLAHRVEDLENESESLKELINSHKELPEEVQQTIKVRIEMLNALMAGYITANDQYKKPYEVWIKELTENTEEFMNSNRLAFQVSHPQFIKYFEDHGLTISEINYVCLYAIGLHGKEVGTYMKKRSHVNISSGIRQKLGIDKYETNIGIYVRKLLKTL